MLKRFCFLFILLFLNSKFGFGYQMQEAIKDSVKKEIDHKDTGLQKKFTQILGLQLWAGSTALL